MDLRNLTEEEFLTMIEAESKASINTGKKPQPSAFVSPVAKESEQVVAKIAPEHTGTLVEMVHRPASSSRPHRQTAAKIS